MYIDYETLVKKEKSRGRFAAIIRPMTFIENEKGSGLVLPK